MNKLKVTKDFVLLSVFVSIIILLSLIPQIGYVTILPGVSVTLVHIPVLVGIFTFRKLKPAIVLGFAFGVSSFIAALIYAVSPFDLAFQAPWIPIIPRVLFAIAAYYLIVLFEKIEQFKYGQITLFAVVSIVTTLGLIFGLQAASDNIIANSDFSEAQANNFTAGAYMIAGLLSALFIAAYFFYSFKNRKVRVYMPSAIILSTLVHTCLVILTVAIFNPSAFTQTFGEDQGAITWMYVLATTNGLIEALVAVFVAVPVVLALTQLKESDDLNDTAI